MTCVSSVLLVVVLYYLSSSVLLYCLNPVCVVPAEFDCRETSRFIHSYFTHCLTWQELPIQMSPSQSKEWTETTCIPKHQNVALKVYKIVIPIRDFVLHTRISLFGFFFFSFCFFYPLLSHVCFCSGQFLSFSFYAFLATSPRKRF